MISPVDQSSMRLVHDDQNGEEPTGSAPLHWTETIGLPMTEEERIAWRQVIDWAKAQKALDDEYQALASQPDWQSFKAKLSIPSSS